MPDTRGFDMLRIDRDEKALKFLHQRALPDVLRERNLQHMIRQSATAFFDQEMGEPLLLIGEELRPAEFVDDRIDLLAMDKQGAIVVIELKRANHKLHLLQALSYASMIAKWDSERLLAQYAAFAKKSGEDAEESLEQFLEVDGESLNHSQRIMLLAENFDFQVLVTAEWLHENFTVDIRCYRLILSADGPTEFLSCTCIYPPPELKQHAVGRKPDIRPAKWPDWETALRSIANPSVSAFFNEELAQNRENYLRKRALRFRIDGKRRWFVAARTERAYVWQNARFVNDEKFWTDKLGTSVDVGPVKDGRCLRFFLSTPEHFRGFKDAVTSDLSNLTFFDGDGWQELEGDEG